MCDSVQELGGRGIMEVVLLIVVLSEDTEELVWGGGGAAIPGLGGPFPGGGALVLS